MQSSFFTRLPLHKAMAILLRAGLLPGNLAQHQDIISIYDALFICEKVGLLNEPNGQNNYNGLLTHLEINKMTSLLDVLFCSDLLIINPQPYFDIALALPNPHKVLLCVQLLGCMELLTWESFNETVNHPDLNSLHHSLEEKFKYYEVSRASI